MIEENNKDSFGHVLVESIKSISDERIEIAQKGSDEKFQAQLKVVLDQSEEISKKIAKETAEKQVEILKRDVFTIFGIFTSFIAFIVGEINILKTIDSIYDKVGFSFLFVSFITGFLFGVMFLLNEGTYEKKFKKMLLIFIIFFMIGIFFILVPNLIDKPNYYMFVR